jgi:hypothetical protein
MKKLNIITTICMLFLIATSCSSDSKETTSTPPPGNTVTYSKDIKPLISSTCLSCHGEGGTFTRKPIDTYEELKTNASKVTSETNANRMPLEIPWTATQKALFASWVAANYPQ